MADEKPPRPTGTAVPTHRLSRMARFGGLASTIAGGMAVDGAKALARGERPDLQRLALTPQNAARVTDQLARLRGAAMKVGQLVSMDAGEMLPPELSDILARLRSSADAMPPKQLRRVLNDQWGKDWLRRFGQFNVAPLAAASIGQVHRARTKDGRDLAIKIQYPGVVQSIDSDVDNVATLLKLTGLLPKGFDITPLLEEAKSQLHDEADYHREGRYLAEFGARLADDDRFTVPEFQADFSTATTLAMSYEAGDPIESLTDLPQERRDQILMDLVDLLLAELFTFGTMQTDPNFANYHYNRQTDKIILLDFGATRPLPADLVDGYRQLLRAGMEQDHDKIRAAAINMGFLAEDTPKEQHDLLMQIFQMSLEPLAADTPFDFGSSDLVQRLHETGMALQQHRATMHIPPMATLYIQRKIGGMYLLASRLKVRLHIKSLLTPFLAEA